MANIAKAFIGLTGQEIYELTLDWKGTAPKAQDIRLVGPAVETDRNAFLKKTRGVAAGDVTGVKFSGGKLTISIVPSSNRYDWTLVIGKKKFSRADFEVKTRTADDKFARLEEGRVMYRLYTPEAEGPHPMILFLHGGGNGGHVSILDNNKSIVTDYGPVNFAEDYPDIYVMAPMAVEQKLDPSKMNMNAKFAGTSLGTNPRYGWSRDYLAKVCAIIRRMIQEGKVDPKRIYVTGMSMGGGGTIRAMSVGSDLFAAAIPVCPTMTPETFSILKSIRRPIWVTSAYIDHTLYRHKYLVDAVMAMRDAGNKDAHLTLFAPEDLEKYDISITPDLEYKTLFRENHWSWVPTYKNEYGIMSWLLNQVREDK